MVPVLRFIARRLLYSVLVLVVISVLTFLIFVKLPAGDPARRAVGRTRTLNRSRTRDGLSDWTDR